MSTSSTEDERAQLNDDGLPGDPIIANVVLTAYLSGEQASGGWEILDDLDGDEAREVAKLAIEMLWDAHKVIVMASGALDDMMPRRERFMFREQAIALMEPYLEALAERFRLR